RLLVTGNSQNIQVGQIWMSPTIRRFDPDVRWGVTRSTEQPILQNRTSFGVDTIYPYQTTRWRQSGELMATTDAFAELLEAQWFDVQGRTRPWLLVPDG